jgi:hypothetical protein
MSQKLSGRIVLVATLFWTLFCFLTFYAGHRHWALVVGGFAGLAATVVMLPLTIGREDK